jgi:hypothetical protein
MGVAKRIRIGELEFEDCMVQVSERRWITGEEGLIGADVFRSYLVDIDSPARKLRLSPLPQRPGEAAATTALNAAEDAGDDSETGDAALPRNRYVAPEMENWTRVFRFGHQLLIPTRVNDSSQMLFVIDTGAFANTLSTNAARKSTKVYEDERRVVRGISGKVNRVYTANRAKLQFSHFQQENQDVVTFDLSKFSANTGIEISGALGFNLLRVLEMKIDYRDGLVDFVYDPKRLPPPWQR